MNDQKKIQLLPFLPGTHSSGKWRVGKNLNEGAQAIFPICIRDGNKWEIVGTGFYISTNGVFITAKHVVLEVQDRMGECVLITIGREGRPWFIRPVNKWFMHSTADLAVGFPFAVHDNKTGAEYRGKGVKLDKVTTEAKLEKGLWLNEPVVTYGYPLHSFIETDNSITINLQPQLYDGIIEELYLTNGPSMKIQTPYYRTSIHLYGGASGGPIFCTNGSVIGVASSSYDGAENTSFVTPIQSALMIEIEVNAQDGNGLRKLTLGQALNLSV